METSLKAYCLCVQLPILLSLLFPGLLAISPFPYPVDVIWSQNVNTSTVHKGIK